MSCRKHRLHASNSAANTIKLLARVGPCEMYLENEVIDGTPPEYYSCFIEAGPRVTIEEGAVVEFSAERYVKLKPGFWAKRGSSFRAMIKSYNTNDAIGD